MKKEQEKGYTNSLKDEIAGYLDKIDEGDPEGQQIIKLICGLAKSGYREFRAGKGGAA